MPVIHVLDSQTIDKIAAGEVVERPSSVVKELVENAIDAGASAVTVEAKDGGIAMIRVTDNGCGMEQSQVRDAFLRHATSKIENAEDLARIHSLGFRGEALSSISAVSQVEIITKTSESLTGTRLCIDGGREKSFDEIGAPDGTTFIMRNLFFNTPVRRKFLKQPATEGGYITDLMEHLAISRPDISFKLMLGNQMRFHTSGNGDLKEVIYRIYGREIANSLVPIQCGKNGMKIEGYLGKPILVRSNRNFEIYFMNGRFIKSTVVARALEEGYKEYLMQHKFPFCVLHITMDTELVDVNVHPTKMDVRFSDSFRVSEFIAESVQTVLKSNEMIPQDHLSRESDGAAFKKQAKSDTVKSRMPEPFEKKRLAEQMVQEQIRYEEDKPAKELFQKSPVWERVRELTKTPVPPSTSNTANVSGTSKDSAPLIASGAYYEKNSGAADKQEEEFFVDTTEGTLPEAPGTPVHAKEDAEVREIKEAKEIPEAEKNQETPEVEEVKERPETEDTKEPLVAGDEKVVLPEKKTEESVTDVKQLNLFEEKILTQKNRDLYHIIGQVFDTYWMFQYQDKLCILDQHAAHEKVKYERFMRRFREKETLSQTLLPPVIVTLSGQEEIVLRECWDIFASLGFEVESFGGCEYALRAVPIDLYGCSEREMFLEVLDDLEAGMARKSPKIVEEKIATMACKAAVKGNNQLSFEEADRLIDELLTLENPYNCPHGRPTIITISKYEMEKKFKRQI